MNKVTHVPAYFCEVGKNVTRKVPTGETKKGIFGERAVTQKVTEWEATGYSDREVDSVRLANDIESQVNQLNKDGYEVVTITPIISGDYNFEWKTKNLSLGDSKGGYAYGYGYGFSYTDSIVIVAKKTEG